jgi:hypothetical protein
MGDWGLFFFSEKLAQLEAFKKTLKDPAEIAKVDAEIAELYKKQSGKQGE